MRSLAKFLPAFAITLPIALGAGASPAALAQAEESARLYRKREEQRDVGIRREITPWLGVMGLLETEWSEEQLEFQAMPGSARENEFDISVQMSFEFTLREVFSADILLEYDSGSGEIIVEEALLALEAGPWELEAGRLYTPLGEFFSRFVSGPILEFAETRAEDGALKLSFAPGDSLDLSVTGYRGPAHRIGGTPHEWDYVLAAEVHPLTGLALGISYQSDLADADSRLLADSGNVHGRAVPALGGWLSFFRGGTDLTVEFVAALGHFREFDEHFDRPIAWSVEVAREWHPKLETALRVEGSGELEEEAELQYGAALTWRFSRSMSITAELLRGRYDTGYGDDSGIERSLRFGAIVSVAF